MLAEFIVRRVARGHRLARTAFVLAMRISVVCLVVQPTVALAEEAAAYVCPMHPDIRADEPGVCPRCGMTLAAAPAHHHHEDASESTWWRFPHGREGSGTSWMPDATPVYAAHWTAGQWMLMLHGALSLGFDEQSGPRGDSRGVSTNWLMGMAAHDFAGGEISLRTMLSAEPLTAGGAGVPLLLQSGETYGGVPLHDVQHPHDLFMEVAARYRHPLGESIGLELYAAPAGEPAIGPPAFMHRASAMNDPLPPIGHHWQDSTHVSFGVFTAGFLTRALKLEASLFNGREPDENRWDFDFGPLDSYALRLSGNPTLHTSMQVSYAFLRSPEALAPGENFGRLTASALWSAPLFEDGTLDATAVWGRNLEPIGALDSALLEGNFDLGGLDVPYLRLEYVEKSGGDLVVPGNPARVFRVFNATLGFLHRIDVGSPIVPAIGVRLNVGVVPKALAVEYGTRVPLGAFVYLKLQPARLIH